ncbi:MAG: SEC-C metal-binding domain-containing protein [Aureliella sp.]
MIKAAFEKQLVDMQMIGSFDRVRRNIVRGEEAFQETMDRLRRPQDLIEYMSGWAAYQEDDEDESEVFVSDRLMPPEGILDDADHVSANDSTFRNEGVKIGRNEKCPCDSGKKYKKCCGKV